MYRLKPDFQWEAVADLPKGVFDPKLLANDNGLYLLGKHRQKTGVEENSYYWQLYYFDPPQFKKIAEVSEEQVIDGDVRTTPRKLLLFQETSQEPVSDDFDYRNITIQNYEEKIWTGGVLEGSQTIKGLGNYTSVLYRGEWFESVNLGGNLGSRSAVIHYDPIHPENPLKTLWKIPESKDEEEQLRSFGHLYLLEDKLYLSSLSRLYQLNQDQWKPLVNLEEEIKDKVGSIESIVGQEGNLYLFTGNKDEGRGDLTRIFRLDENNKISELPRPPIGSWLPFPFFKAPDLFLTSPSPLDGIYVYRENQWRKISPTSSN